MNGQPPVIAIDGPTASGKGTIAQRVADGLGFHYLDSGALYRLLAWKAVQSGVEAGDEARLARLAQTMQPRFRDGRIELDGVDVTEAIRTEEISRAASKVACIRLSAVRCCSCSAAVGPRPGSWPTAVT